MLRRTLIQTALSAAALYTFAPTAFAFDFKEGTDYVTLEKPLENSSRTLIKIFSYDCPWCFRSSTGIDPAALPAAEKLGLKFDPRHLETKAAYGRTASEYFAMCILKDRTAGRALESKDALFRKAQDALYFAYNRGGERWTAGESAFIATLTEATGIPAAEFASARKTAAVLSLADSWKPVHDIAKIQGIPGYVVNGRYLILIRNAGSVDRFVNLISYLAGNNRFFQSSPAFIPALRPGIGRKASFIRFRSQETTPMTITRRELYRLTVAAAAGAILPKAAFAFGGPSGAHTIYKVQGHIGEVELNPYKIAPLTAVIHDGGYVLRRVRVRIVPKPNGQEIAYRVSDSQVMTHGGIPVFGLYPDYVNQVQVSYDRLWGGRTEHFDETYKIYAAPAWRNLTGSAGDSSAFPRTTVRIAANGKFSDRLYYVNNIAGVSGGTRKAVWNSPEGGALQWSSEPVNWITDTKGEIRWYLKPDSFFDVNSIWNGGIMMGFQQNDNGAITWGYGQHYVKYDIMGRKIWNRRLPFAYSDFSHSLDAAQNGHYFLRVSSSNLKRADGRNVHTVRDLIIEVNAEGAVVDQWRLWEILDPYRDTAIKALDQGAVCLNIDANLAGKTVTSEDLQKLDKEGHFGDIVGTGPGRNWAHVNSVDYDPTDDSIIISSRHQCAVVKIGRDHRVKWILGGGAGWKKPFHDLLLTPVDKNGKALDCDGYACHGTAFDWPFTQHTAFRIDEMSDKNTFWLSVFDNGDARHFEQPIFATQKYSRAVIYKIDQKKRTVEQVWEYGKERGHGWFSPVTANVKYMKDKHSVLVYSATAGANYDLKTGGLVSAPNPYLDEFEWGAKKPSIELQFQSTTGYQAFVFDPEKAFNSKVL